MFRRALIGLAVMVPILALAAGVGLSQRGKDQKRPPNLGGEWLLDQSRSDSGRGMGGRGGKRGGPGSGEGQDKNMNGRERGGRGGRARLPEHLRIEQMDGFVRIADSTGLAIEEIGLGKQAASGGAAADTPRMQGEWNKDRLQVVREGRRGKMTQSFAVEEDGRVLVIRTKMESDGSRPSREFKRVYRRIGT